MNTSWRIAGVALVAGLALFLISLLLKLMVVALATFVIIRVVGGQLARRFPGPVGRMDWSAMEPISIDNPSYRFPANRARVERIIPIG